MNSAQPCAKGLDRSYSQPLNTNSNTPIQLTKKSLDCKELAKKYGLIWAISAVVIFILMVTSAFWLNLVLIPLVLGVNFIATFSGNLNCLSKVCKGSITKAQYQFNTRVRRNQTGATYTSSSPRVIQQSPARRVSRSQNHQRTRAE